MYEIITIYKIIFRKGNYNRKIITAPLRDSELNLQCKFPQINNHLDWYNVTEDPKIKDLISDLLYEEYKKLAKSAQLLPLYPHHFAQYPMLLHHAHQIHPLGELADV